ncbi:uncharacterized protein LOC62_06G008513 [Vanrija pseudolonga]|uniref:Chromo domain-containing protein n=1 Tax=Vanrija pseudolonga TaxID=143232 RepID=A0AAF0YE00_9TREE|nr:hypothetical protein LOC62_06G008513 [Vanrija pseudolonga]
MSSSRLKKGKAPATAASSSSKRTAKGTAKASSKGKAKRQFTYDPTQSESDVTEDDGEGDVEYEVDAIKYAWWQDEPRDDRGWRYGVMWKGYLKSTSDTVEPLTSFNEDEDGRIPFIDDFWQAVADRPLMRGTHEPLSGRVDEILETPKALLEEWLAKCRPRRDYEAYRRRRRAERNEDMITKGMSDYYINHKSLLKFRRKQAAKAAGKKIDSSDSDDAPKPPKKKARGDMGPPAPVKPKKQSTPPEEDLPYSGPFPVSAEAGPSPQAGPSHRNLSETALLDSLFEERSSQDAGSRSSSQPKAPVPAPPAPKRRLVVDSSPEPPSQDEHARRAAERADKVSKMGKIKKQKPEPKSVPVDPPTPKSTVSSNGPIPPSAPAASPSFGVLDPGIFGTAPSPAVPSPAMPSPSMPSPAQSPYIPPAAAAQQRDQKPLFDFGNAEGRSPTESEIDIDEAITVKAEEGAAPEEPAPAAEEPMAVDEEVVPAPKVVELPEAVSTTDAPADAEEMAAPDAVPPLPAKDAIVTPPPDETPAATSPQKDVAPVQTRSAPAVTAPSSSTATVPPSAGLPPKPIGAPAEETKPTPALPPRQRGKYVQPKRIQMMDTPTSANPQLKRLGKLVTKTSGTASAGPSSAGPSSATSGPSAGISPSGPPPFPLAGTLSGSGVRWKSTPAAQVVAASAKPPSSNYVPRGAPAAGPGQQGARSPVNTLAGGISPLAGGRSPHDARGGGASPYDARAGGRSPYDQQRGDVRPPTNPYSNRSPISGNLSPLYAGNTLMSTVSGAVGKQRVDGASGWSNGQSAAAPPNGNRSPPWAQAQPSSSGFARPTRPPPVGRPATVDPTRDPRRRAAAGAGASANPAPSTAGAPPAMRPPTSTAPQLQPLGELSVALAGRTGKESYELKVSRGSTQNSSGIFSLSRYISDVKTRSTFMTENAHACLDMALGQGAFVREWAQVQVAPENARAWEARVAVLKDSNNKGAKILVLRDEVRPAGLLKGHDLLILARAEDAAIDSMLGPFQIDQLGVVLIIVAMPLVGKPLPTLPNPVNPDFEVIPQMQQSAANATTILQSYGLNDTVLSSFRGKTSAILPNLSGTREYETVQKALVENGVLPPTSDPPEVTIILNGHWPRVLSSTALQKYVQSNTTKFYCLGPDLQLPVGDWPLRDIWYNGGLVMFSPMMVMSEPGKVREVLKRIRSVENWAAYITPLTVLYIAESWDKKQRCPDKSATVAVLSELLFANEDLDGLAGDRPTDSGGLAVSMTPPDLEWRRACATWIDWRERVKQCTSFDALIELCKSVVGEGGRLLRSGGASPTKTIAPLDALSVDEGNIRDLMDMRSRPEIVPYRRFMYIGGWAPKLDEKHVNRVEFLRTADEFNWVFSNSL